MKAHTSARRAAPSFAALALALAFALHGVDLAAALDVASTVVTVKVTTQSYDAYSPWRKRSPAQEELQGCVLEGGRILTVAGPLADQVQVEVSRQGSPKRYAAELLLRDPVAGLALLTVRDRSFFDGLTPPSSRAPDLRPASSASRGGSRGG